MINATEVTNDLAIILSLDEETAQEYIIKGYIGTRLLPLKGTAGINETRIDNLSNIIYDAYITENYGIDIIINAIYNYINLTNYCPPNTLLSDDIETFLKMYAET